MIRFIRTTNDRPTPVDVAERKQIIVTDDGRVVSGWTSHFATCPNAAEFRSKGPKETGA